MQATPIQLNKGKKVSIYGLLNPISNKIFYIGATCINPLLRFYQHIYELKYEDTKKTKEIYNILMSGNYVEIIIIEERTLSDELNIAEIEQHYIDINIRNGAELLQKRVSSYPTIITSSYYQDGNKKYNLINCQDKMRIYFNDKKNESVLFKQAEQIGYSHHYIIKLATANNGASFTVFNKEKTKSVIFPSGFFVKKIHQNKIKINNEYCTPDIDKIKRRPYNIKSKLRYPPCPPPFISKYSKYNHISSLRFVSFIHTTPIN